MHRLRRGILLGIIGTSACSHYRYTHTAYEKFEPSSKARCEFRVLSTLPADGKYVEIGVINLVNGDAAGTTDVNRFKQEVQANVCSARGDVVVGEVNPQGFYVRGTVFRKVNQ